MGNNGGLLLCIIITHYYIRIMSCVHVIMSYNLLLHVIAYCCISAANTMCDVLTGPRSSTSDILDTPDDNILEPYGAQGPASCDY